MSNPPVGLIEVEPSQLDCLSNLERFRNEISPFGLGPNTKFIQYEKVWIDPFYGQVFDSIEGKTAAVYGKTGCLPDFSGDELANMGFLRVPYRRIPRILVKSRQELEKLVSGIDISKSGHNLLFRGQTREYCLPRSPEAKRLLYGEENIFEPSLLSSAERRGKALEACYPEWALLVQSFLESFRLGTKTLDISHRKFCASHSLNLFSYALAQHYGLPSSGLDVSDRLEVALFFALHKYREDGPGRAIYERVSSSAPDMPVIYILYPDKHLRVIYRDTIPEGFNSGRPFSQSAHFISTGWGHHKNHAARFIFLALYLEPGGDFGVIPKVDSLFPEMNADPFGGFLAKTKGLPEPLASFVSDFRWITDC